ncbi:glutamate--cysteine ligase [Streptomyces sp. NPDC059918]|uniref:carboxylate-amine ligase n=1 Tax=unclassified Streptomyces TaxID=2593676 RepID=UPI0036544565
MLEPRTSTIRPDAAHVAPPSGTAAAALTLGVEEEFLLVDAVTGRPAPVAPELLAAVGGPGPRIQGEATRYQVEIASPVAATADELRASLRSLRGTLAAAARELGSRLVASPVPLLGPVGPPLMSNYRPRQLAIQGRFGSLAHTLVCCGRHVHVGPLDTAGAVASANRMRPWTPTLIAIGANSPYAYGADTGHACWRTVAWSGWPSAGCMPHFADSKEYERAVRRLVGAGAAVDPNMVYWDLRPSRVWPTLEIRAPDVSPDVDHAVLFAVLGRALVLTGQHADRDGLPVPEVPDDLLRLARWRAAHDGLEGQALNPFTGAEVPAADLAEDLLERLAPALAQTGDLDFAADALHDLIRSGSWAARQREVHARRGELGDVVGFLADATERV